MNYSQSSLVLEMTYLIEFIVPIFIELLHELSDFIFRRGIDMEGKC